jgi:hypothetical protein
VYGEGAHAGTDKRIDNAAKNEEATQHVKPELSASSSFLATASIGKYNSARGDSKKNARNDLGSGEGNNLSA